MHASGPVAAVGEDNQHTQGRTQSSTAKRRPRRHPRSPTPNGAAREEVPRETGADAPPWGEPEGSARRPLATQLALLLALVACIGGVNSWRAEAWGARAAHLDRQGIVEVLGSRGESERARTQATQEQNAFQAYVAASARRISSRPKTASDRAEAQVQTRLAALVSTGFLASEVRWRTPGDLLTAWYDVDDRTRNLTSESSVSDRSRRLFAASSVSEHKRLELFALDLVLALGLAAAGIGQISTTLRARKFGLFGGVASLIVPVAALVFVGF